MDNFLSIYLVAAVTIAYFVVSCLCLFGDNPKMGLVFAGYAISNIGLILLKP